MGKYVKDVNQDQKIVPELLESIMNTPGLVKEELRLILCINNQFRFRIQGKIGLHNLDV